jgi:hypothetical protein
MDSIRADIKYMTLDRIFSVSSEDYQKRIWINCENPKIVDSIDETICDISLYRDLLEFDKYEGYDMTEDQKQILKNFFIEFDNFYLNNDINTPEFMDGDDWKHVMEVAKGVLKAFDFQNPQDY